MIHVFGNFLTKLIIAKVIEIHMSESIPISDAKKMRSGVNVEAEVIEQRRTKNC